MVKTTNQFWLGKLPNISWMKFQKPPGGTLGDTEDSVFGETALLAKLQKVDVDIDRSSMRVDILWTIRTSNYSTYIHACMHAYIDT